MQNSPPRHVSSSKKRSRTRPRGAGPQEGASGTYQRGRGHNGAGRGLLPHSELGAVLTRCPRSGIPHRAQDAAIGRIRKAGCSSSRFSQNCLNSSAFHAMPSRGRTCQRLFPRHVGRGRTSASEDRDKPLASTPKPGSSQRNDPSAIPALLLLLPLCHKAQP